MLTISRTNSDQPDFKALTQELDQELCTIYGTKQEDYDAYNRIVDLPTVVLAYENGTAVGCGCFRKFNDDTLEIKRMYVLPAYRGKGIASRILYELETWGVEQQYTYATLETGKGQPIAIDMYIKCGYTITPNYGDYVDKELSICMFKALWTD